MVWCVLSIRDVVCCVGLFVIAAVAVDFPINDVRKGAVVYDDESNEGDEREGKDVDESVIEGVDHRGEEQTFDDDWASVIGVEFCETQIISG